MDTVKWALELKDKVSPAGKAILRSMSAIGGRAKELATKGLSVATKGLQKLGEKTAEVIPKIAKWAAIATLAAGVGLVAGGTKLAADALAFMDSTLIAMRALLKSNTLAGTAYKRMLDFAHFFGEDPTEAIGRFNKALADGFSARDAEKLLQAFGDLKLVTPNINADSLTDAFGKIRQKGILELGDFQGAVSAAGLNLTLAYEAIGKKIGKGAKQVEQLIASGRVNAQVGLVGLLEAINQRTNSTKLGEKLGQYAETASGLVQRLKNLPQQFMLRMTADDSPIKGTLKRVLEQLDPDGPNGKRIIGALNAAFAKVSDILATWATPEGIEKLTKTIGDVIAAAPKILKALGAISGVVMTVIEAFTSFRDNCRFLWAEFTRGGGIATAFLATIGLITAPIVGIGIAVYGAAKAVIYGVQTIWAWLKDLGTKAATWGGNIADGLWKGLKDAWAGLLKKIGGLVDMLPAYVKKALGISSPSKVFAKDVGRHIPTGIASGVEATAPAMNDTIVAAIDGGHRAGAGIVNNATSSRTSSSSSKVIHVGGISVTVEGESKNGRQLGTDIGRGVTRELELAALA